MELRYSVADLTLFARELLVRSGLDEDKAQVVAEILVEGDLLGHTTHGLQLLGPYLNELEKGTMTKTGSSRVIADYPAAVTWDGNRLPGPWLVVRAIELAMERASKLGTCTVSIRRSHHIAALAAYLQRVTDRGMVILLTCSDPNMGTVAPYGGTRAIYTPNPIAAGWPTGGDPVLLDISTSITSNGLVNRLRAEGKRLPGPWLMDSEGNPTDDPNVVTSNPPGTLLPVGGMDHGHKGFALSLLVEALSQGFSGHGRADPKPGWGASVFLQILDPALFGGVTEFTRQTQWLADACHDNPPREGFERVRMPGESGLRKREDQLKRGVQLHPGIFPTLEPWAKKLNVPIPLANL